MDTKDTVLLKDAPCAHEIADDDGICTSCCAKVEFRIRISDLDHFKRFVDAVDRQWPAKSDSVRGELPYVRRALGRIYG